MAVHDGYADWEVGHVLAELRRLGNVSVVGVGFSDKPVLSMGGLHVRPSMPLARVDPEDVRIFIPPGGDLWEKPYPQAQTEGFLQLLDHKGAPMAAICAATTVLAKAGALRNKKHTSNSLRYLCDHVPGCSGHDDDVDALAVTDGHLSTAGGLGSVDFTMKIL